MTILPDDAEILTMEDNPAGFDDFARTLPAAGQPSPLFRLNHG